MLGTEPRACVCDANSNRQSWPAFFIVRRVRAVPVGEAFELGARVCAASSALRGYFPPLAKLRW